MRGNLWKKLDKVENPPCWLEPDDDCFYARDYVSRGKYDASEANQLIANLKKPMSKKGTREWQYKISAIDRFVRELSEVLEDGAVVAPIPSSMTLEDPEYDPRIERTLQKLSKLRNNITVEYPISKAKKTQAAHLGGQRNPNLIYPSLKWHGFKNIPDHIILIDDIITSGSHFKACKRLIKENHPSIQIFGVFWARTIWLED